MRSVSLIVIVLLVLPACTFNIPEPRVMPKGFDDLSGIAVPVDTFGPLAGPVIRVDFRAGSNILVCLSKEGSDRSMIEFWYADSGRKIESFRNEEFLDLEAIFSHDGKSVAIGSLTAFLIDSEDFGLKRSFTADAYIDERLIDLNSEIAWPFVIRNVEYQKKYHFVSAIAFSPDDRFIVSGHENHHIKVWDTSTGRLLNSMGMSSIHGAVTETAFSPDGRYIAACQYLGNIHIWTFPDYREIDLADPDRSVNAISFDPYSGLLAGGCSDGSIVIWEVQTGKIVRDYDGHLKEILALEFTKDGLFIGSCGTDNTVQIRNAVTGEPVMVLVGHSRQVNDLAFNSNASLLASCSDDMKVILWDISAAGLCPDPASIPQPVFPVRLSCEVEYVDRSGDGYLGREESSALRFTIRNDGAGTAYQLVSMILPDSLGLDLSLNRLPVVPMILPGRRKVIYTGITGGTALEQGKASFSLRVYEFNGFHLQKPLRFTIPLRSID
ncbi:MAG: WD40 repeat domain-containing protein [Bacteroidales bacterium]|nr:WD40 repeat domain-containing protein [Candidatus Latescibacterota bacterium]